MKERWRVNNDTEHSADEERHKIKEANILMDSAEHELIKDGRSSLVANPNSFAITEEEARVALSKGVRIGYASICPDYMSDDGFDGYYGYYPVKDTNDLNWFFSDAPVINKITIEPAYDMVTQLRREEILNSIRHDNDIDADREKTREQLGFVDPVYEAKNKAAQHVHGSSINDIINAAISESERFNGNHINVHDNIKNKQILL